MVRIWKDGMIYEFSRGNLVAISRRSRLQNRREDVGSTRPSMPPRRPQHPLSREIKALPRVSARATTQEERRMHIIIQLPCDHTDAVPLDEPEKHCTPGMSIVTNPTYWQIGLAKRWVEHIRVDPDGDEYDLSQPYIFKKMPENYHFMMTNVKNFDDKVNIQHGVLALHDNAGAESKKLAGSRGYVNRIWNSVYEFWPRFCWLMESKPAWCDCTWCGSNNRKALGLSPED